MGVSPLGGGIYCVSSDPVINNVIMSLALFTGAAFKLIPSTNRILHAYSYIKFEIHTQNKNSWDRVSNFVERLTWRPFRTGGHQPDHTFFVRDIL